ncbi:MAG TPA: hypothetical protein VMV81_13720 [Phycisphaerae bacterium]|nr:hypothetical protein [Phycisphaerae bacterium]
MNDKLSPEELTELIPSRSSILKKVPLETRRLLNRAIIFRNPITYEGIYNKFNLESLGVSYTAFYYYARRIHLAITASELGKLRGDPHELISAAVAQTILDVAAEPILTAKHLANMARAYRDVEMARSVRIRTQLAEKDQENWLAREDVRHKNRLELKALDLSNRLTLEDRKSQHNRELAELKSHLSTAQKQNSPQSPQRPSSASPAQLLSSSPPPGAAAPRYGRHPDGRPRTRQEFLAILRPQVYEIYGIDPPKNWPPRPNEPRAQASGLSEPRPPASDHERSESEPRPSASGYYEPRAPARGHSAIVSEHSPLEPPPQGVGHQPSEISNCSVETLNRKPFGWSLYGL